MFFPDQLSEAALKAAFITVDKAGGPVIDDKDLHALVSVIAEIQGYFWTPANQTRPRRIGIDGPRKTILCFCANSSKTSGSRGPAGSDA
jgi:hypothetical protein